eukprot:scaffold3.g6645.t1
MTPPQSSPGTPRGALGPRGLARESPQPKGCAWIRNPPPDKSGKESSRRSFTLWSSGRREANPPHPPAAPPADASEDNATSLSANLFDLELGSLELGSLELDAGAAAPEPAAKAGSKAAGMPAPAPPASLHRRRWSFGRKVAPAEPAAPPADAATSILDTTQSDLPRISTDGAASPTGSSAGGGGGVLLRPSPPPGGGADAPAVGEQAAAAAAKAQGYRRLWQSITSVRKGDAAAAQLPSQLPDVTVEGLVRAVQRLKLGRPVTEAVAEGLPFLDSRAVAALLKELSKCGLPHRAAELFDWLRSLAPEDPLARLADLYTYTTIISQCGGHQQLRRALELVGEMRGRGIEANIHTYSALMSVCVKCGECDLALDVYQQLLAEGCTPNLVTSNILIDIYGKTGQWAAAVEVLDALQAQGTTPEPRTYNTAISACAKSGQPAAAFRVYQRMLADGVAPTGTTYTSLISAYGKAGQVEEALAVYEDMTSRGAERPNVITYSSLISACDRAGRCDLALSLWAEMQREGCRPNVVTYNGMLSACAQAGLWHKASELFEAMLGSGCRPDAVTYSGFRPDACVYSSVLEALWGSGLASAQAKALQLADAAFRQGRMRLAAVAPGESTATAHTYAAALAVVLRWLCELREAMPPAGWAGAAAGRPSLLLARSKHCRTDPGFARMATCLGTLLSAFSAPLAAAATPAGLAVRCTEPAALAPWLASPSAQALLSPLASAGAGAPVLTSALFQEDVGAEGRCGPAFAAVAQFEAAHAVASDAFTSPAAAALRQELVSALLALGHSLQLPDEVTLEAVQLCDRLINRGAAPAGLGTATAPLFAAGALLAAARGAGDAGRVLRGQRTLMRLCGLSAPAVLDAEQQLAAALGGDTAAISALRVLHLYLERLGCNLVALAQCELMQLMALAAADVAGKAALSPAFARYPPSLVAAAALAKARQGLGLVPFWPTSLERMTGYVPAQEAFATCCEMMALLGLAA